MRKYSILHPLFLSFFSRSLYRDVAQNWKGLGFLYLLLLLALCWIPAALAIHRTTAVFVDNFGPALLEQVPTLTITNGEVSIREPQPYILRTPGTGVPLVVVDTTGRTTSLEETEASALLTRHQLIVRRNPRETRIYDLTNIRSLILDRDRLGGWLKAIRSYLALVLYPLLLLLSYAYRIIQALLYGAIGILFARVLKAGLEYPALVRLAAVSVTPVIVLGTLRWWSSARVPYWWPICFLIAMGYLLFAVRANSVPEGGSPA